MRATILRQAQHRTPLIKFVGKRTIPESIDHAPHPHPASPTHELPDSFVTYRKKAQQHGPLGGNKGTTPIKSAYSYGAIGGRTARDLGSIQPKKGEFFDRSELPARFRRTPWSQAEIDAIETGGASLFV